jgi:hypothetical protein
MNGLALSLLQVTTSVLVATLALATTLTVVARLGSTGRAMANASAHAPLLDVWVALFTWIPWVFGGVWAGWIGLAGTLVGQMFALGIWCLAHELLYREAARGPRIVKFINRTVGRWRNHLALWVTLIALPGFWFIRIIQIVAYWPLVVLLGFPNYKQSDWVNVSRQKFEGLVGHDLVWCLYCDWMTGVYSLGAEMLRNVESFWCPIRFYDGKKCENCRIDFPDIEHGWVAASGNMHDVEAAMEEKYSGCERTWFGHPARLTVSGREIEQPTPVELGAK